jgi:hypothetical protein
MLGRLVVGCAGPLALLTACHVTPDPTPSRSRPLTDHEAAAVSGGVSVDITYPAANNSYQTFDNLRFTANVISDFNTEPTYVSIWADGTKVGSETMNFVGNETKVLDRRTNWPFPGNHDAQLKFYYDGQYYAADGDSLRTDQRLHASVKVRPIRFWTVRQGASLPSISSSFYAARVDATDTSRDKTSDNIDGIFGQCSGNDRTQFRGVGAADLTPSYDPPGAYDCSDLGAVVTNLCDPVQVCGNGNVLSCVALTSCLNAFAATAVSYDDNAGYISAHIFNVDSTPCGEHGRNVPFSAPSGTRSLALMDAGLAGNVANYTKVLAHELMHDAALGHCNDGANPGCAATECVSGSASVRNLMCTSGAGRVLTSDQCTLVKTFRWSDRN